MESTSRDPFAFFAACGCGRNGCTRHILAGDALRSRAAAA
jgi:predicted NBD/HSP70 family sugar kinase